MKNSLSSEPRIPSTGKRPSKEVNVWLRVACRVAMLSTVRLLGSEPGD